MPPAKRKASDLAVPARGDDPTERKRVLNVLAQRRYRQRRRNHVQKLEQEARGHSEHPSPAALSNKPGSIEVREGLEGAVDALSVEAFDADVLVEPSGQLFDDPCDMFDPTFATISLDLQTTWETSAQLPSLRGSPIPSTHASSLTSLSPPGTGSGPASEMHYSFPDEAHLEVLELNLLRGATAIAQRLEVQEIMWSLTSTSPFTEPSTAMKSFEHLPLNLRPTIVQLTQPHHPVLDVLPWPAVRDKLITVFSQPTELRPPSAASPMALVELVYDIEDSAEGVRIWGDDPCSDQSWEVGEKVFSNWWWAFDSDVLRRSNEMRRLRGARLLGDGTRGSILGEVA